MTKVKLPYGKKSINIDIPEDRLEGILVSKVNKYSTKDSEEEIVKKALITSTRNTSIKRSDSR